jgi:hypothetical protein
MRTAAALFPDDHPTQFNLALALHRLGDEESAVTEFARPSSSSPGRDVSPLARDEPRAPQSGH